MVKYIFKQLYKRKHFCIYFVNENIKSLVKISMLLCVLINKIKDE